MVKSYYFIQSIKKEFTGKVFGTLCIFIRGSALNTTVIAVPYMIYSPDQARIW